MTPYLIYGADISPYMQRLTVQLDIKGLAYRVMPPPGGLHSDTFRAISPIGKIPVLQAGDFILPESEVICDYIEDRHPEPALRPAPPEDRARTRLIARIVDLYVMGPMTPLFGQLRRSGRDPAIVDPAIAAIEAGLSHLDRAIDDRGHAVGDTLSLADLAAAPVLRYIVQYLPVFDRADPLAAHPRLAAYWPAIAAQPGIARGIARIEAGWAALRAAAKSPD
ncbi:MAG: glutathione S-transferase family protein [Sphingobium sp.]